MKDKINEEVSVLCFYSAKHKKFVPNLLRWRNKDYELGTVDYYHTYMDGRERQHIFELADKDESIWFRLRLNSSNLHCILEATHDGLAS